MRHAHPNTYTHARRVRRGDRMAWAKNEIYICMHISIESNTIDYFMHTNATREKNIAIKFLHSKMTAFASNRFIHFKLVSILPMPCFCAGTYIMPFAHTPTPVTHNETAIKSNREQTSEQASEKYLKLLVFGMCVCELLNCRSHFFQCNNNQRRPHFRNVRRRRRSNESIRAPANTPKHLPKIIRECECVRVCVYVLHINDCVTKPKYFFHTYL